MAVLVGVLAPTLIRNVEKSRESTDLQTLDSIRSSVSTALSIESVNSQLSGSTSTTLSAISGASGSTFLGLLNSELSDDGVIDASMKSKSGQSGDVTIEIAADGKVTVSVKDASGSGVVTAAKSKTAMEVK